MLREISQGAGFGPAVLVLLVVLVAVYSSQRRPGSKAAETQGKSSLGLLPVPRSVSSTIPIVGHLLGYVRDGHSYFSSLCLSTSLPVFTIHMPKVKLSLIQPVLTRDLPKVKHLSLAPLVLELFRRSLDLGQFSAWLLREEDVKTRRFSPEISRLFREEFIPNRNLRKYVEELDEYIQCEVGLLEGSRTIRIEDWIFRTLVGALGKSLWGGDDGPFGEEEFISQLRTFLLNIQALNNPAKFAIDKKILASRQFVRDRLQGFSFEEFAKRAGVSSAETTNETFLARVRSLCLAHGAAAEGWTDYQLLLIAGLGPNVMAASTWMFHHLLASPPRLVAVRQEIDDFVARSQGSIDLADIPEACPLLLATWHEVLRFHGGFTIGRFVHEDTTLAGKYLLKKGSFALAPLRPHHRDPRVWGDDADEFSPERFLREGGTFDDSRRKHLRVYGLFGTLCPGRFLAVHMAMALTVRLLLAFELAPIGGAHAIPSERKDTIAGLPTPAWDADVELRRRDNERYKVEIRFRREKSEL